MAADSEQLREAVRERYARIARESAAAAGASEEAGCGCGCACGPVTGMQMVEYAGADRAAGVVEGANLGLGCGIPTLAADLEPGQTVLDLGSGAGVDVFMAAARVGSAGRVIGVDMTPEMIALARANARQGGYANVEFRLGEIEHLPVADASVDVVISNCVINLAPDKEPVFREIHRVLRPGGSFAVSDVVSYGEIPEEVRSDIEAFTGCIAGAMDQQAYLDLISRCGFAEVRIAGSSDYDYFTGRPYGVRSVTVTAQRD